MLSTNLKSELTWFGCGCLLALMTGAIIGWVAPTLLLFLAGYVLWLLHRLEAIVGWLRSGAKANKAPFSQGLTDEMVQLIHREKKYSRKQKNRFRRSLAQFNSLAANLPDAIIVLDEHREIRWSNPAARSLLTIHPERDRGQRIDNLVRNPQFSEFLASDESESRLEIDGLSAVDKTLEMRKVPSQQKMVVLIVADITQRAKVREMRKAFVADVSHELRTPLTVIRGYLEMIQELENTDPVLREALTQVATQSDRMRGIVEDLLELSKLESNPLGDDEGQLVNMPDLIHSMLTPLSKEAPDHHFAVHLDESLAILGSERELYSVCNNLLTNAVKYTQSGSTIGVDWTLDASGVARYTVTDDGPGIESRHLSRLSERFYRVDAGRSREEGGTGLGLAIVKHAVQRHGGQLEISSTPGAGSQFSAVFPPSRVQTLRKVANQ